MSITSFLDGRGLAKRLKRLRQKHYVGYSIAIAAVAIATLIRAAADAYLPAGLPFITYFGAVAAATLLGGFWPGTLAVLLSALIAWFVFFTPPLEFAIAWPEAIALFFFILFSMLLVAIVAALNRAIDRSVTLEQSLEAEIERCRRAERDTHRLAAIVESSDDAIVAKDLNGIITSWNKSAEQLFGYTAEEMVGHPVSILIPPDRSDEEPGILSRLRRGERIDHYETVRQRKDGTLIDVSLTVSPIIDSDGTIIGASKIARDISERKRAAEQKDVLIREMSHRVKNAFAVMGGVVAISARTAATPQAMASEIQARLAALTRAHDLTRPGLIDSQAKIGEPMSFHALVRAIFAPFLESEVSINAERLTIVGPDIPIAEKSVTGLALLIHELVTNAVKCGCLSTTNGSVRLELSVSNGQLTARWVEAGGPLLNGAPQHEGFGSVLARRIATGQFGGQLLYDWRAEGLVVSLSVPVERLTN
jgi:PAS domain S-box-containing protein